MEAADLQCLGELHRVSGAVDIGELLVLGAGVQVVDRGQMKHVLDLALELFSVGIAHAQVGLAKVAEQGDDLLFVCVPRDAQRIELLMRFLAHENVDGLAALEQILDQKAADEPSAAGDEVSHFDSSSKTFGLRSADACVWRANRCRRSPESVPTGGARARYATHYTGRVSPRYRRSSVDGWTL